jgi:predicted transcriptional regulator
MTEQLALFKEARGSKRLAYARVRAVLTRYQPTSREAWRSVLGHLAEVDAKICEVLLEHGGATCDEVERDTALRHQTVSAQLRHLVEAGLVQNSSRRRPTRSGRNAIVWELV